MRFGSRVAAVAALGVLAAGAATAGTVAVTGPASATPGGVVTLAVSLPPELSSVFAIQGALEYDPAVLTPLETDPATPEGFHDGDAEPFPGESIPRDADLFRINPAQAGKLIFGYVKNPSSPAGSPSPTVPPVALRVAFRVAAGAAGQTTVALAPYEVNGQALPAVLLGDAGGAPVAAEAGPPHPISITLRGDADGDGAVAMNDVLLALQAAGGIPGEGGPAVRVDNADVWPPAQPDGQVTLEDALRIGRFLTGLETDLN